MSRLVVVPAVLFVLFAGGAFTLANLHPAQPSATASVVKLGNAAAGAPLFAQKCAACHGQAGRGGPIGPKLAGRPVTLARAQAQIDTGSSIMPAGLVKGQQESDVLAYLATILKTQ